LGRDVSPRLLLPPFIQPDDVVGAAWVVPVAELRAILNQRLA
jgi:hypothetical protein